MPLKKPRSFRYIIPNILCLLLIALQPARAETVTKNGPTIRAANAKQPIILVHGFSGFERKPGDTFFYWGGWRDLQSELIEKGAYDVRTAFVGPFSSNWDRACELYAYIKGGRVDYGAAHAARYGHKRFGRTYPGIYPEWGERESGEINTIAMIGHSMGGQTARLLIHLLEQGDREEKEAGGDCSPLFQGGKCWVNALMTIATPHDGTVLAEPIADRETLIGLLFWVLQPMMSKHSSFYPDFQIDHWAGAFSNGLSPLDDEFVERAKEDIAFWDLSLDGATQFNRRVPASPNVYYFSWSLVKTASAFFRDTIYLYPNSYLMDRFPFLSDRHPSIDESWRANDGVVNTVSMAAPRLGSTDRQRVYDGVPVKGLWNLMGLLENTDHGQVIGLTLARSLTIGGKEIYDWYAEQAALLTNLPR